MAKDPAFLFYSSDFLTGVIDMTMEERGQYITLMCLQHQKGHLSDKTIRFCVGFVSDTVMCKFQQDDDGHFYNDRLDEEIEQRNSFLTSRRKNGQKGGRPAKNETTRLILGLPKNNLGEDEDENENEDENKDRNGDEIEKKTTSKKSLFEERFDQFWAAYPKKVAKGEARKSWAKIKPSAALHKKILAAISDARDSEQWTREKGRYIPNPATWLNQQRWDDELPKEGESTHGIDERGQHTRRPEAGGGQPSAGFDPEGFAGFHNALDRDTGEPDNPDDTAE